MRRKGSLQQKILLLFLGSIALGLSGSPTGYFRTLKAIHKGWKNIDQRSFNRSLHGLCEEKLLKEKKLPDGTITLVLTENGKLAARRYDISGRALRIARKKKWDGKWRVVTFDVPEKKKTFRDIIRDHLKAIGFKRLQNSVFIFPYPCEPEILALVDVYGAESFVRVMTVSDIDNTEQLKKAFSLT
ncbi:MAG: hypothetical protein AAB805_01525 [Patescibacteria group bacterium]